MDTPPDRWRKVERLVDAALDLPAAERDAFLDRSCSGDADLRRDAERYVRACERAEGFLEVPAPRFAAGLLGSAAGSSASGTPAGGAERRRHSSSAWLPDLQAALGTAYSIEGELGGGGMSRVFVAVETALGRRVVIKVLPPDLAAGVKVERFRREIRLAASLQHPHIVPVLQAGQAGELLYYTMPFVEGESLRARLAREGAIPAADALRLLGDIAEALAYAHGQGIVHRDLKPGNVLLSRDHAMVVDFGVAKALRTASDAHDRTLTRAGFALGTPAYMAPEQAVGDPATDHRADIYALGAVAYEMLTGTPPFTGDSPRELMAAHVADAPEPLATRRPTVPARLASLVMHCLEKRPDERPQSAEAVLRELEAAMTSAATAPTALPGDRSTAQPLPAAKRSGLRRALAAGAVLALIAAGIGGALLVGRNTEVITPGRAERVTIEPSLELDPALSPDGKEIAYASDLNGRMQLYVKQLTGGRALPITSALPGYHRWPRWSPDGSRIAFQAGGSIYVVAPFGGPARLLVSPPPGKWVAYPAWSPDGKQIAYVENDVIYTRSLDGGAPRRVGGSAAAHSLAWSPDGEWIAFVSGNTAFVFGSLEWGSPINLGNVAPSSIWVVPARGGTPVRVTDETSLNTSPVWLPRGHQLLFVSNRDGSRDVYRVSLDRSGSPAAPPVRLTTGLGAHTIGVSADAKRLVYSVFSYSANVWSIRVPKEAPISVAEARPVTTGSQAIEAVALSPDGRWLAFDSDRTGNQDVYKMPVTKMPATGGEPVQLTTDPGDDFMSSWSPDGREIAFYAYRNGTRRLQVMSADGGAVRGVTDSPSDQRFPGWSPDGRALVFHSYVSGRPELYLISRRADSSWGAARRLTRGGGKAGRWSPDGRLIAYTRGDGVWLIAPQGGEPRPLVRVGDRAGQPAPDVVQWSPDGKTVYYKALDVEGHSNLWAVPAVGGTPRLLVRFDDPERQSNRPEFTTDGKRFFFTIGQHQSDIWMMELTARQ